jgi:tetraacyldisaccharide 4'-kinase
VSPRLQRWFEQRWYGGREPGLALRAAARLFGAIACVRRLAYRRGILRSTRLPVPVLVVGNLAIGGSGKTPMTLALVAALARRGWRPGVVARGHGGSERGPVRVPADGDPRRFGDEPCLVARRSGVPVAVARRRVAAAQLLLASGEVDLLVADDGLQHYALQRDVEIVMVDGRRGLGNGRLLPAGPLREPARRAADSGFRVVAGGGEQAGEWLMAFELGAAEPLAGGEAVALARWRGGRVHAVAGIADPSRFFVALRDLGLDVVEHGFGDHHAFTPDDLSFETGAIVLMTEKDAVKCRRFARPGWYAVPLQARLPEAFFDAVDARLRAARVAA